ncbi:MAG: hypothetical protein LBH59_09745 [Planctomycetaceae bacterium]|nr:hypothetical protein [Planctomycetaceae bacterium]
MFKGEAYRPYRLRYNKIFLCFLCIPYSIFFWDTEYTEYSEKSGKHKIIA